MYGVLTAQLLLTFGIIMFFNHVPGMREYARHQGQWMYWVGFVVTMVSVFMSVLNEGSKSNLKIRPVCLTTSNSYRGGQSLYLMDLPL